ncbi:MAG: hypothetical protein Q4E50_01335 [Tissierellia bacterium]|nr:hypothetical protein [Tissierellia bacterium]
MIDLLKYELKKHSKIILVITLLAAFVSFSSNLYLENFITIDEASYTSGLDVFFAFIFLIFNRLLFLGLFAYFTDDFVKNLTSHEKNFLFSLPIKAWKFFAVKILSISLLVALVIGVFVASSKYIHRELLTYSLDRLLIIIANIYTGSLFSLLLAYAMIMVSKKYLETSKFNFLWIIPFAVAFSIYFTLTINLYYYNPMEEITFENSYLILTNLIGSLVLFKINCWLLDKKIDI